MTNKNIPKTRSLHLCIILGSIFGIMLIGSTAKAQADADKPDLKEYSISLKKPLTVWYIDKSTGLRHFQNMTVFTHMGTIQKKYENKIVSTPLTLHWQGNFVVIRTNTHEYLVHSKDISHYQKALVKLEYDKAKNRWKILDK